MKKEQTQQQPCVCVDMTGGKFSALFRDNALAFMCVQVCDVMCSRLFEPAIDFLKSCLFFGRVREQREIHMAYRM
jgi:hypothetical protein